MLCYPSNCKESLDLVWHWNRFQLAKIFSIMIPETNIYCTSISFACWMWILLIEPKLYSWQRVHQHIRLKHFDFLSNKLVYHIPEQKSWRRWLETHHFVYLLIKCGIKYWKEEVLWINFGKQSQWLCNDFRYFYIKRGPSIQNRSQAVATGNQVINPGISHHHPHFNYVSAAAAASLISSPVSVLSLPKNFNFIFISTSSAILNRLGNGLNWFRWMMVPGTPKSLNWWCPGCIELLLLQF